MSSMPEASASSMMYWIVGLSTIGSISLGQAFVAGKKRVPKPAAGITALVIFFILKSSYFYILIMAISIIKLHTKKILTSPALELHYHT